MSRDCHIGGLGRTITHSDERTHDMTQCKARTNSGAQCVHEIKPPSKSLCTRHRNQLDQGKDIINIQTGRKFPKPR